ncbi:Major facilitator superfamily domain, general substrate transporter [Niveomyces insectorum RCEF 264]|uniref:Major facilitator superfamily domain, general substrate transporter n=1 Tax=Niveomyces insectorum RCEF 264 TaxID=1081102 RepID=A0A167XAF2_9HYPO|nr:Major facilitator superfamily domain, general substrate transporter [Niveomyces insectorum RCEF 264]
MSLQLEKSAAVVEAGLCGSSATTPALGDDEVTWDGPDDPADPYNWPSRLKITHGLLYSASQLVTTMSASMIAPALDQVLKDLRMTASAGQIAFSVFFLGLGFAPFLVAPLAEVYGRKPIWIAGNIWYILWNSLCPVGFSPGLLVTGRFLSASGASVGITLTSPVLADMYSAKDRGKSIAIASLLPYLGPALGPIIGGLAAQHLWWPWLFWILSAFDAVFLVLGFFVIHETYAPVLLARKARRLTRDGGAAASTEDKTRSLSQKGRRFLDELLIRMKPAILRPVKLLISRPIIQIVGISMALQFGIYILALSTFASLWITRYGQSETSASLHYIAIALGAYVCAQGGGRLMDWLWRRKVARFPNREPTPEYRMPYVLSGLLPLVAGLFWYAWAAETECHWVVVDLGIFFFTCGGFVFAQGLLAYLVDEFGSSRAASANAATRLLTYLLGFAFPIFAPKLYLTLGYGWGNSLLAFLFVAICFPIAALLWFRGERIRSVGRKADGEK